MGQRRGDHSLRSTTIVAVRRHGQTALAGDGQVTLGDRTILKHTARKVRRLYRGSVLVGIAGAAADGLALLDRLEGQLEKHHGQLLRAAVDLAREWRTDRVLRQLDALLLAADRERLLVISGSGEVVEPDDNVAAVGSGAPMALAAARALVRHTDFTAAEIAQESLRIAASICVYTNDHITLEVLDG